jgi:hypothetical protein
MHRAHSFKGVATPWYDKHRQALIWVIPVPLDGIARAPEHHDVNPRIG